VEILGLVQHEPWAAALYLEELYLPQFESIPAEITPEQLRAIQLQAEQNLLTDPEDFLTQVRAPVLAVFGENDLNVNSSTSAALYESYLTEAGNPDFTIEIIPGVGHGISLATPGYWDTLITWLTDRYRD
jgi:pimeloyl-ACP methyl ester carboxylesterase